MQTSILGSSFSSCTAAIQHRETNFPKDVSTEQHEKYDLENEESVESGSEYDDADVEDADVEEVEVVDKETIPED